MVCLFQKEKENFELTKFLNKKVLEVIDNVDKNASETCLMESFNSPSYSDYFVAYLR